MISFAKVTSSEYALLTPVQDRIYFLTDTGEQYLNGKKYGADPQVNADWDESDSTDISFIQNKPNLNVYVEKEAGKGLSSNDFTNELKGKLEGIESNAEVNVQADWEESDSSLDDFIKHKPSLATVATSGSYNDLSNKPAIPAAQVQTDWDESDSQDVSFLQHKPVLEDANDYLCFTAKEAGTTVALNKVGSPDAISLEYSTDKKNWTAYTWSDSTGATITLSNIGDKVYFRGNNDRLGKMTTAYHNFVTGTTTNNTMYYPTLTGNVMSLVDKTCRSLVIPSNYCFARLFSATKIGRDSKPRLPALVLKNYCYYGMFYNTSNVMLNEVPELPAPESGLANYCYYNMFSTIYIFGDIDLRKVFPNLTGAILANSEVTNAFYRMFYNAPNHIYCHFTNGGNDNNFTEFCIGTFEGAASWAGKISSATFVQSITGSQASRDAFIRNTVLRQNTLTATEDAISVLTCSQGYLYHNATANVTVNATASSITLQVMYAEFVVDVASGVTLTAGTNMTFVDTPTAGKRSICVLRWTGSSCRLYVVDEQDIPA